MTGTMILESASLHRPGSSGRAGPALFWRVFTHWAGLALAVGVIAGLALPTRAPTEPGSSGSEALVRSTTGNSSIPDPAYQAPVQTAPAEVRPNDLGRAPATTTYAQVLVQARKACARELEVYGKLERQKQRAHTVIDRLYDANGDPAGTADQFAHASDVFAKVNSRWLDAVSAVGACYENHGAETGDAPVNIQP